MGDATVCVSGSGLGVEGLVGAGVGRCEKGCPLPEAVREATACRSVDAISAFDAWGIAPGTGRRYMLSMVGLRAAPKGVDKKSVGRSCKKRILDGG